MFLDYKNHSKQYYMSLNDFNHQPNAVHQNNYTTIHGIFALLRNVNGADRTRYKIESDERSPSYPNSSIDQYYTGNSKYWANEGSVEIKIIFDAPFHVTGYAVCNAVQSTSNSSLLDGN